MAKTKPNAFSTRAVHTGERTPGAEFTPVSTPIQMSVGYLYESMDEVDAIFAGTKSGYVYPRYGSPTVSSFEEVIADLENGEAAHAFATGMAALHVALLAAGVRAGAHVVAAFDLYGATFSLLRNLFTTLGAEIHFVDAADLDGVASAVRAYKPVALLVETVSNPLVKVADLERLGQIAAANGVRFLVDNTFASPLLVNPIDFGADFVIHSATKYIGGHGDLMAGIVVSSKENRLKMYELNKLVGSTLGPFEAWLALRGVKTLPLRVKQQCQNAAQIADWLSVHPKVAKVNYPGLAGHPQHALAERMFGERGFGGMLSFEIKGADQPAAFRFMERLKLCLPATTLGDIYSLVLHPATSSHRALTAAERAQIGIPDGLIRLSAGIEAGEDIIADLAQAFEAVG